MRHPRDCYLTPPCVTQTIAAFIAQLKRLGVKITDALDPFAGAGLMLEAHAELADLHAIEIDDVWRPELVRRNCHVTIGDAFAVEWPATDVIVTNPPFGSIDRAIERVRAHGAQHGSIAMVLVRTDYLQHPGRPKPEFVIALKWRPQFGYQLDHRTQRPRLGTDYAGYAIACWGVPRWYVGRLVWADRPRVTAEAKAEHRRLALRAFELGQQGAA